MNHKIFWRYPRLSTALCAGRLWSLGRICPPTVEIMKLRRQADDLACGYPRACFGALAVETDLPCAQQLFEFAMSEDGVVPPEPAVQPCAVVVGVNLYLRCDTHRKLRAVDGESTVS